MKLSIELYENKTTIETPNDDISMNELYPIIRQLLLGAGYGEKTVKEYFDER